MDIKQIQDFLKSNPEKVAAGVVVLIVLLYLIISPITDDTTKWVLRAAKLRRDISQREQERSSQQWTPIDVTFADDADDALTQSVAVSNWPEWFAYKRPFVPLNWREVRPELAFLEEPELNITLQGLTITLTWQDSPENKGCTIKRYIVWRKEGMGEWRKIAELERDKSKYQDTNLKPLTKYKYRLETVAVAQPRRIFEGEKKQATVSVETEEKETPFPWEFEVKTIMMPGGNVKVKTVRLVARHRFKGWESKHSFRVEVGQKIVFRAKMDEEWKDIDTGCKLLNAGYMQITHKRRNVRVRFVLVKHIASGKKLRIYRPSRNEDFVIKEEQ